MPIVHGLDEHTIQTLTQCATPKHDTSADASRQCGQLGHNRLYRSAPVRFRFSGGIEARQIVYICPSRQPPSLPPRELPFSAVEDNREKLEQWLLSYYKASSFNTCHRQPLLPMEGTPLRPMIHPDTKPVACHTPIDIPVHWRDDVIAGLDQD